MSRASRDPASSSAAGFDPDEVIVNDMDEDEAIVLIPAPVEETPPD